MAHVIIAVWKARAGEEEHIADTLRAIGPGIREEPKVLSFHAQRRIDDPRTFVLYERYVDPSGYEDHQETETFRTVVVDDLVPRLETRSVHAFTTID